MFIPLSVLFLVALFTGWWVYFYKFVGGPSPYRRRMADYRESQHGHRQLPA